MKDSKSECIETIRNIIRPVTIDVRLAANITDAYLLLTLLENIGPFLSISLLLLPMEPWAVTKKSFTLVSRCHQLLSEFLAHGHFSGVSGQSHLHITTNNLNLYTNFFAFS